MPNAGDVKDDFDAEEHETHATVLDKLLAWEKKLYDEVKVCVFICSLHLNLSTFLVNDTSNILSLIYILGLLLYMLGSERKLYIKQGVLFCLMNIYK